MAFNNISATLRRVTPAWWLALIGPLLLIDFPATPFANNGCDPWYVFGLYHDLPLYVEKLSWARQPARLATNLPGFLFTHIFYGIAADYALFLLIYTLAVIFLFKAASLLLSRREALLVALFFALSPYIVANYSWTFSGPAVTYEIIALYCAMRAVKAFGSRKRLLWIFISGLGWGAALNSHLASLIFGTFIYFFFALCVLFEVKSPRGERIKLIILSAFSVIAGVSVFNAVMCLVAVVLFHAPYSLILQQMLYMPAAMKAAVGYSQLDQHLQGPKMGAFLLGIVLSATAAISYGHRMASRVELTVSQRQRFAMALAFLLTFACLLAHEILFRGIFLQFSAYYHMLWPFLALVIFAIEFDWDMIHIPVPLSFFVLCVIGLSSRTFSDDEHAQTIGSLAVALAAGGLAIAFLNVKYRAMRTLIVCAFAVAVSGTTFFWRTAEAGYQIWEPRVEGEVLPGQYQRLHFGLNFLSEILRRPSCAQVSEVLDQ